MWSGPVPFTAIARDGSASAASTAVHAAQLTTTAGRWWSSAARTAPSSVMSRTWRSSAVTGVPRCCNREVRSRPSMPDAPVTSHRGRGYGGMVSVSEGCVPGVGKGGAVRPGRSGRERPDT